MRKLFLVLAIILLVMFSYVEIKKSNLEKSVEEYLTADRGYELQEIKSIGGVYSKLPVWSVSVVFEDERNIAYQYQIESGIVEQYTVYPSDGVSKSFLDAFNRNEINLKHLESN